MSIRIIAVLSAFDPSGPGAFWGPIRKLEVGSGRFKALHLGFDSLLGGATAANALSDTTLKDLHADSIRINGGSQQIAMPGVTANTIEEVRAR